MTFGRSPNAALGGADKHTQETFSEAEGLLNAMEYLHGEDFTPRDMHTGNIMMRPDSGQLVMVDVGLFGKRQ
jgi:predicted unusual protein kinase regulating ubiquinone biosynthesis (AarF/ABC1/UbiB family)